MYFHVFTETFETMAAGSFSPPEYGALFWEGEARNRTEARRIAVGQWLKDGGSEVLEHTITVEGFETCPEHGHDCENTDYSQPVERCVALQGSFRCWDE